MTIAARRATRCGREHRFGWRLTSWSVAFAILVATAWATIAFGADSQTKEWRGRLNGISGTKVYLRVDLKHGHPSEVNFGARGVPLHCDDGSTIRTAVRSLDADAVARRKFAGAYGVRTEFGLTLFERFTARLGAHGQARGTLVYLRDEYDPPSDPAPPECSTDGILHWRATQTRD